MADTQMSVLSGFDDPVLESQAVFRVLLDAFAHPGRILKLDALPEAPAPLYPPTLALCLTLADLDTALWLDETLAEQPEILRLLRFQCGSRIVDSPAAADFALVANGVAMPPLARFKLGSEDYPDRSTTLIVQVRGLWNEAGATLSGPGIETTEVLEASPLPLDFWDQLRANRALFPRGVDVVLAAPDRLVALPRSVRVQVGS